MFDGILEPAQFNFLLTFSLNFHDSQPYRRVYTQMNQIDGVFEKPPQFHAEWRRVEFLDCLVCLLDSPSGTASPAAVLGIRASEDRKIFLRLYKYLVQPRREYAMHLISWSFRISRGVRDGIKAFFQQPFCFLMMNSAFAPSWGLQRQCFSFRNYPLLRLQQGANPAS